MVEPNPVVIVDTAGGVSAASVKVTNTLTTQSVEPAKVPVLDHAVLALLACALAALGMRGAGAKRRR